MVFGQPESSREHLAIFARRRRVSQDALIAPEKITHYLLIRQNRSDKSAFLEKGGFSILASGELISSLAAIREANEAQLVDDNKFGRYCEIVGALIGPNGIGLRVRTIWMTERLVLGP